MAHGELQTGLAAALSASGVTVVTDPDVLAGHEVDWTGRWRGDALGLARPVDTGQVASALRAASDAGVPVQVQGGNTGLVGGSVPGPPSLILSTAGMTARGKVERVERTVVVGAGVTCAEVSRLARAAGLAFGIDLASRDSATVGGMVATNAGGMEVIAHGPMRQQVRGLRAVLADGRLIDTIGRPRKDNVGFDLTGLLVGSEGALGVVTDVELVLQVRPPGILTGLVGAPDLAGAVRLARTLQDAGSRILAAEVIDAAGLAAAARLLGVSDPLAGEDEARWALLVDIDEGTGAGLEPIGDDLVAVAVTDAQRERLWRLRHRQSEVHARRSGARLVKLDLAVRLDQLDELVADAREIAREHGADVGFFGHALDGNIHVQVHPGRKSASATAAASAILAAVARRGGSISAEHGLGRQKADWLDRVRSADQVALMRQIKQAVDPQWQLNPGVLLTAPGARAPRPDGS